MKNTSCQYQSGGRTARQVGHSSFTSSHCVRHSSWNLWLQGVFIITTSSSSSSRNSYTKLSSLILSPASPLVLPECPLNSTSPCRQIAQSSLELTSLALILVR
jgi:hypothetical protein